MAVVNGERSEADQIIYSFKAAACVVFMRIMESNSLDALLGDDFSEARRERTNEIYRGFVRAMYSHATGISDILLQDEQLKERISKAYPSEKAVPTALKDRLKDGLVLGVAEAIVAAYGRASRDGITNGVSLDDSTHNGVRKTMGGGFVITDEKHDGSEWEVRLYEKLAKIFADYAATYTDNRKVWGKSPEGAVQKSREDMQQKYAPKSVFDLAYP